MSGARPDSETAKRMGVVPYNEAPTDSNSNGNISEAAGKPTVNGSFNNAGYPTVAASFDKTGNPAQENVKTTNDQPWSNGSGSNNQGSNSQGVPINPSNGGFQSNRAPPPDQVGGGYFQAPQLVNWPWSGAPDHSQQQEKLNWQTNNVQQGIPVSNLSGGYVRGAQPVNGHGSQQQHQQQPNWEGPMGGYNTEPEPAPQRPIPKGDYVYYDGNGNQVQPDVLVAGSNGNQSGCCGFEKHSHHHYYHDHVSQSPQPIGYPYDSYTEQDKKRKSGVAALATLLVTCWACTCCPCCCCHDPCCGCCCFCC